jgi:hypothetical protein
MEDGNSFLSSPDARKTRPIYWIGSPRGLKDDFLGHQIAIKSEQDIAQEKHVKRALPRPTSDEEFFPLHG